MNESSLTIIRLIIPISLSIFMFTVGLSLKWDQFSKVLKTPKLILIGAFGQIVCLPVLALIVSWAWKLEPKYALGLLLLSACPGGPSSNLLSYLAKANVALSVVLTTVSSLAAAITVPFVMKMGQYFLQQQDASIAISFQALFYQILFLVSLPMVLGMVVGYRFTKLAHLIEPFLRKLSVGLLVVIVGALVVKEAPKVSGQAVPLLAAVLSLIALAMICGVVLGTIQKLDLPSTRTLVIEIAMQNAAAAIAIATSSSGYNDSAVALPAMIYGLLMYFPSFAYVYVQSSRD